MSINDGVTQTYGGDIGAKGKHLSATAGKIFFWYCADSLSEGQVVWNVGILFFQSYI